MNTSIALAAASAFSPSRLDLTLFPTEKCQFRCTYCYEDFAIGRMPKNVIAGVKNLISERSKDLDELLISWFGGEPLLALDVVREIMEHSLSVGRSEEVFVSGSMTTNADLLDSQTLRELIKLKVGHFQITLDGPEEHHDKSRVRVNGNGTFDSIWQNLISAKNSNEEFEILLRLHITPDNKADILDFADNLCTTFLKGDNRFDILPMAVGDWGGPNTGNISVLAGSEGSYLEREIRSIMRHHKGASETNAGPSLIPTEVCYAAKPNAFLVRADGRIAKCTVALDNKLNSIGSINSDGTLSLDQLGAQRWLKGWENLDEAVLGCPLGSVVAESLSV